MAIQVDQQKASGNQGNKIAEPVADLHHRAAGADLPVADAGAGHDRCPRLFGDHLRAAGGRGGQARPPGVPAGPVPADRAGARRGHRLRAVPGLPGPRGAAGGRPRREAWTASVRAGVVRHRLADLAAPAPGGAGRRIVRSVTRVGESITFSAATVIAAVLTLLLASFSVLLRPGHPVRDRDRRDPARRAHPAARAAVHPAVAAGASSGRSSRPCSSGPSCCRGTSRAAARPACGAGSPPGSSAARRITLAIGVVVFGGLALGVARLRVRRVRRQHHPAGRQRLGGGHRAADQALPAVLGQPDRAPIFKFSQPVWDRPVSRWPRRPPS